MNRFYQIPAFVLMALGVAACAGSGSSSMNAGERISQRGGEITQYGDTWQSGKKSVRDGEKLDAKSTKQIADARKRLARAEADQAKAQQMITDGKIAIQRSEADYAASRVGPAAIEVPQQ